MWHFILFKAKKKLIYYVLFSFFLFLCGCFPKVKASYIEQFVIDYKSPQLENIIPLNTSLKIERFSIIEIYNNTRMHYKTSPFKLSAYSQSKWRVNPADLLYDYFIRDVVNANIVLKVFSYKDPEDAAFSIEGGIEEFVEIIEDGRSYSVLTMNIVLVDNRETSITKKIIFQKKYREKELLEQHSPEALAKGMSVAFKKTSVKIIEDIYINLKQKKYL